MLTPTPGTHVIVNFGPSESRPETCTHAHHHDVPEVDAEGESTREAVTTLLGMLTAAAAGEPSAFRRRTLDVAAAEVREFLREAR
ncbi:MAG: hypothetical protein U0835_15720 [Isosphaeraceae bacterium]